MRKIKELLRNSGFVVGRAPPLGSDLPLSYQSRGFAPGSARPSTCPSAVYAVHPTRELSGSGPGLPGYPLKTARANFVKHSLPAVDTYHGGEPFSLEVGYRAQALIQSCIRRKFRVPAEAICLHYEQCGHQRLSYAPY